MANLEEGLEAYGTLAALLRFPVPSSSAIPKDTSPHQYSRGPELSLSPSGQREEENSRESRGKPLLSPYSPTCVCTGNEIVYSSNPWNPAEIVCVCVCVCVCVRTPVEATG